MLTMDLKLSLSIKTSRDTVTLGQDFLSVLRFPHVSVIPPVLLTHLSITYVYNLTN
jgi:hypothetical protein